MTKHTVGSVAIVVAAFAAVSLTAPDRSVRAQSVVTPASAPLTIDGTLRDGQAGQTPFELHVPAAWNGTFVVDLDFVTGWRPEQRQWFLSHGYAIGGTRRTQNESAYRIRDYVENFMILRRMLAERAGRLPARTIAYGVSRGGIPARAAMEIHPDVFTGGVVFAGGGLGIVGVLLPKLDVVWTLKTLVDPASAFPVVGRRPRTPEIRSGYCGRGSASRCDPR